MTIGPQLPPHLTRPDETDDEAAATPKAKPSVGPSLPPHLKGSRDSPPADEDTTTPAAASKTRSIGPALPPHLAKRDREDAEDDAPEVPRQASSSPPAKKARTVGPAPPPAPLAQRPSEPADDDDSDDDDDDYGPALPGAPTATSNGNDGSLKNTGGQHWDKNSLTGASDTAPKKRNDWMLMPPEADDLSAKMDPTKIRARKFNSKPGGSGGGMSKSWTETPEEKRKRLEDQVLGLSSAAPAGQKPKAGPAPPPSQKQEDRKEQKKVGPSLYEMHKSERQQGKGEDVDDPTKRAFDWEKDMKVGGNVSHKQKREMMSSAKNYGGRFSKGSSL